MAVYFLKRQIMKQKLNGGVVANSISLDFHSKKLALIRYRDHIELRNATHPFSFDIINREAVGWIIHEEDEFVVIMSDRSVDILQNEVGFNLLIIIKSDILELREIK